MPGQSLGTSINNQAHIYFDFNDAIITNMTTVVLGLPNGATLTEVPAELSFELFPNPTSGQFSIEMNGGEGAIQVSIFNLLGQLLKEEQHQAGSQLLVDFEAVPGVYLVRIKDEKGKVGVKKLSIKN